MKKGTQALLLATLGLTMVTTTGCGSLLAGKSENEIVVAGKNFTEQDIMASVVGILLEENTDLKVTVKSYLGGTDVVFNSMKNGTLDAYVEYTGTGLVNILEQKVISDQDQVYDVVKKEFADQFQLEWLKPIGFNNTYALAVTQDTAQKYGLQKVSDLQAHAKHLTFGVEQEFLERSDGLPGLKQAYGFEFAGTKAMDPGLKYQALMEDEVQVIDAFSTDGRLVKNNLVILEDDKKFFPPYYAAPIVRQETVEKHPEVKTELLKLAGTMDETEMAELNAQVDVDKRKADDVAREWLKAEGLIK